MVKGQHYHMVPAEGMNTCSKYNILSSCMYYVVMSISSVSIEVMSVTCFLGLQNWTDWLFKYVLCWVSSWKSHFLSHLQLMLQLNWSDNPHLSQANEKFTENLWNFFDDASASNKLLKANVLLHISITFHNWQNINSKANSIGHYMNIHI